jgi:hypothetical protein
MTQTLSLEGRFTIDIAMEMSEAVVRTKCRIHSYSSVRISLCLCCVLYSVDWGMYTEVLTSAYRVLVSVLSRAQKPHGTTSTPYSVSTPCMDNNSSVRRG